MFSGTIEQNSRTIKNKRNIEQQSKDNRVSKISFSKEIEQSATGLVDVFLMFTCRALQAPKGMSLYGTFAACVEICAQAASKKGRPMSLLQAKRSKDKTPLKEEYTVYT